MHHATWDVCVTQVAQAEQQARVAALESECAGLRARIAQLENAALQHAADMQAHRCVGSAGHDRQTSGRRG